MLGVGTSKLDQQVTVGIIELSLERARFFFWFLCSLKQNIFSVCLSVYRPILAADYCFVFDSNHYVLAIYIWIRIKLHLI